MRGKSTLLFVVSALALGVSTASTGEQRGAASLPPGAKFCPLPGSSNEAFMQSYFAMDAKTGQVSTVSSIESQAVDNSHLDTGEVLLLVAPNGNYDNVFVPPDQAGVSPAPVQMQAIPSRPTTARQPQPMYMPQPVYAQPQPAKPSAMAPLPESHSEVANQAVQRSRQPVQNDERIPWWKGGMWRNRDNDDDREQDKSASRSRNTASRNNNYEDNAPSRSAARNDARSLGRAPRILDDDEMWDDGEYTGYNADGSFGRPAAPARAAAPDPRQDPYAAQRQQQYPAPAPTQQPPMYANPVQDPYAAPAYNAGGYQAPVYSSNPYDTVPTIVLNNNATAGDPYAAAYQPTQTYTDPYASYGTAGPVYSDPYATATPTYTDPNAIYGAVATSPYGSSDSASWPLATVDTTPSYQGTPSIDAQGSPQFENAVRLVKDNRFSEAKNILTSETSRNPANAAAWRWLADCHYNLLELEEAINSYQRALERDPNDYYALRGQGFSYLHRGHEFWRRMQEEVSRGEKETAAATFAQAHENYKKALEMLGLCLRRAPNDGEAGYGEAMAAEGASRKLYSNAISYLKLGPEQRERAELFAENCLTVINKGIERSKERAKQNPGDAGPRALLGGLYLRKAILYHQLGKNDLALIEVRNSRDAQLSILDEIDKNNESAKRNIEECEAYWQAWGGNSF